MTHVADTTEQPQWVDRAETLLEEALYYLRSDEDAITKVTEALAALYLWVGESEIVIVDPADYREHVREKQELTLKCSCPPELVARGGWQTQRPVHGVR
jgi:hypothetical protein